jgi:hypothetical protein
VTWVTDGTGLVTARGQNLKLYVSKRQLIIMHIPFEEEAVLARGAGIETPSAVRTSIAAGGQRESAKC